MADFPPTADWCNCSGCIERRAVQKLRDEQRGLDSNPAEKKYNFDAYAEAFTSVAKETFSKENVEAMLRPRYGPGAENPDEFAAKKADKGKLRYDLISPEFEEEVAKGLTHGASKYDDFNYLKGEGLELKRPLAALRRHLAALQKGQDVDSESNTHHAACVAINAMFLFDLMIKKGKKFK